MSPSMIRYLGQSRVGRDVSNGPGPKSPERWREARIWFRKDSVYPSRVSFWSWCPSATQLLL